MIHACRIFLCRDLNNTGNKLANNPTHTEKHDVLQLVILALMVRETQMLRACKAIFCLPISQLNKCWRLSLSCVCVIEGSHAFLYVLHTLTKWLQTTGNEQRTQLKRQRGGGPLQSSMAASRSCWSHHNALWVNWAYHDWMDSLHECIHTSIWARHYTSLSNGSLGVFLWPGGLFHQTAVTKGAWDISR